MTDLTNEIPLEFYTSTNSTAANTLDLVNCVMEDYINESMGAAAQRTVDLIGQGVFKVKGVLEKITKLHSAPYSPIQSSIGTKGFMDIRDIVVPTMPGFTSTYSALYTTLSKHSDLLKTLGTDTLTPTLKYLEHMATDIDLLRSRAPTKDIREYKIVKFDVVRDEIAAHFKNNDTLINRTYGEVFTNLKEYDEVSKSTNELYAVYTDNNSINKVIEYSERIEVVAQKLYLKYFTDSKQLVSGEVRTEVARLIRECAIGSETLAFYIHILSLTKVSLSNIATHLKIKSL